MNKISCFIIFLLLVCSDNIIFAEQFPNNANLKSYVKKGNISNSITNVNTKNGNITSSSDKVENINELNNNSMKSKQNNSDDVKSNQNVGANKTSYNNNFVVKKNVDKNDISIYHIVQPEDNIYRISLKYKINQKDLIELNKLNNSTIKVGQKLLLPSNAYVVFLEEKEEKNNLLKTTKDINVKDDKQNGTDVLKNKTKESDNKQQQSNLVAKLDSTSFLWPSRGVIFSKFGHKTHYGQLEGVNILSENGATVRASASGEVVYNDNVIGFDNVIIIRHYNGFFTAYGHTEPVVVVGDKVKKGQVIAHILKGKQSKKSILYFTIRKNGKSYDPEKIIQTKISN